MYMCAYINKLHHAFLSSKLFQCCLRPGAQIERSLCIWTTVGEGAVASGRVKHVLQTEN